MQKNTPAEPVDTSIETLAFLTRAIPDHAGELEFAIANSDKGGDGIRCHAYATDAEAISKFLADHATREVVVSLFGENESPFGFTLIFPSGASALNRLPTPSVTMTTATETAVTYIFEAGEDATAIADLAVAQKPGEGGGHRLRCRNAIARP